MKTTHLLSATALAGVLMCAPMTAWAQVTTEPAAGAEEDTDATQDTTSDEGTIVVVGSRIRRNQFNTADPIQIVTRDEATQAGFISTSEILQSTAVTGGTAQINDSYGGFVVDGGPGVNTISLRGLGATRTLVLLNGRRVSPAGSRGSVGSADLNVLPNAMIDRIEILNTGASSIYGSDAVAGVINIVTRTNVTGLTLEAQHVIPESGAGFTQRYSAVFGVQSDRFHFAGSLEYYKRDRTRVGDRDFTSCPTDLYVNPADNYVDPRTGELRCFTIDSGGVTVNTIATPTYTSGISFAPGVLAGQPAGYTTRCNRFRPNPSVIGGNVPGFECVGGTYFRPDDPATAGVNEESTLGINLNIRDTYAPALLEEDLISGAEIYTGFAQASYELDALGDAEIYAELLVNRRNSDQSGHRQFTIDYPVGSPLIPAGYNRNTAVGTNSELGFQYALRSFTSYGIYNNRQTVDFAKLSGGLRGDLFGDWRYDFYASKSWSDSRYTTDLILSDKLSQSLRSNAAGTACADPSGGCVLAPAFGPSVVAGDLQNKYPAWFNYVTAPVTGYTQYRETVFNFTVDGPLFNLPAGAVQTALGVEYRKGRIDDTPGEDSQNNNLYGFTSSSITRGSDSVWEAFGEVEVPVIRNKPFFYDLTLNGSARYTEYASYGGDWTYKVGGLYSPTSWLGFRGSYGTSYRAPALYEQFLGATSGFQGSGIDPCDQLASVTNQLVIDRCRNVDNLPAGFLQTQSVRVNQVGGADAGLEAETSTALTFGGVLTPNFGSAGRLSLAVDYFRVEVDNGVSQLSASAVLNQCYASVQRTTCYLVTRNPATNALTVIQSYVNISTSFVEGIDYTARYSVPLAGGNFRLGASLTQFLDRYDQQLPTDDILHEVGLLNTPEWTGTFDASFQTGRWNFRYGVEWIQGTSDFDYLGDFGYTPAEYDFEVPDYFLHSASIRYETSDFGITLGVRNLFDTDPPTISNSPIRTRIGGTTLYSGYDYRGRTVFINVRAGF